MRLQLSLQAAGYALRISCTTPVLSSALGMAGIGFSSILAGEASRTFGARLRGAQQHRSAQVLARDMALDAVLGMSLYKVRWHHFCMPAGLASMSGQQQSSSDAAHTQQACHHILQKPSECIRGEADARESV